MQADSQVFGGDFFNRSNRETVVQQIFFGVAVGATYALVALGFSMQFRAMNLLNFAHGESFRVGAFIGLLCHVFLKLPLWGSWIITMASCLMPKGKV